MVHQETKLHLYGSEGARQIIPERIEKAVTGRRAVAIDTNSEVVGLSIRDPQKGIDGYSMYDRVTGTEFFVPRSDLEVSDAAYVNVADIVEGTLNRSPVTIVIH